MFISHADMSIQLLLLWRTEIAQEVFQSHLLKKMEKRGTVLRHVQKKVSRGRSRNGHRKLQNCKHIKCDRNSRQLVDCSLLSDIVRNVPISFEHWIMRLQNRRIKISFQICLSGIRRSDRSIEGSLDLIQWDLRVRRSSQYFCTWSRLPTVSILYHREIYHRFKAGCSSRDPS